MVLLELCFRCVLDMYYNLAGGNKGLELKREDSETLSFTCRDGRLGQGMGSASSGDAMKQEEGWCKRNPDRKEFREV